MSDELTNAAIESMRAVRANDYATGDPLNSDSGYSVNVDADDARELVTQTASEALGHIGDMAADVAFSARQDSSVIAVGIYRIAAALERIAAAMERNP